MTGAELIEALQRLSEEERTNRVVLEVDGCDVPLGLVWVANAMQATRFRCADGNALVVLTD